VEEKLKKWVEYFLLDFLIGQYQGGFRKSRSTTKLLPTGAREKCEENIKRTKTEDGRWKRKTNKEIKDLQQYGAAYRSTKDKVAGIYR
jgi:hypothetical protein